MKIIFLNTWGGELRSEIGGFLREQSGDTDIFCFQEAYDKMKAIADEVLAGYEKIEANKYVTEDDNFPQAAYIKKNIPVLESGAILQDEKDIGLGLYAKILLNGQPLYVCNFHGMSRPVDKLDNPGRLRQSQGLIDFFKDKEGAKIIGGDFNIFPETKSVQLFSENGYRDLIQEFKIPTTRNQIAWEKFPDNKQYFSDYIFMSPGLELKHFSVPDLEISDHLPLILEVI